MNNLIRNMIKEGDNYGKLLKTYGVASIILIFVLKRSFAETPTNKVLYDNPVTTFLFSLRK
jgi:hypothetical protein